LDYLDVLNTRILQVIQKYLVGFYILQSHSEMGFTEKCCGQNMKKSVISNYNCIHVKVGSTSYIRRGRYNIHK